MNDANENFSSFIVISGTRHIFVEIDSTGFNMTHASQYYTDRTGLRRKYAKLSIYWSRCITTNHMFD
ncbi:MAG: hypothetical protein WBP64_12935 [Nitrososphaeraceae archaeon]